MSSSIIQRSRYTPRNAKGLEGIIELEMTVVSDYLFVGSGKYDYYLVKSLENIEDLVEKALKGVIPDLSNYFSPKVYLMNKYSDGKIVIPGSTIKGMVRSRLELSIPGSCYIVDRRSDSPPSQTYIRIFKPDRNRRSDEFDPREYPNICPVCNLLGNMGLGSRVSFSDFVMTSGKTTYVNVHGSEFEVVTRGSKFIGKVVYHSLTQEEIGMILYGFGFRKGTEGKVQLLGRFKFSDRRFGRVKFMLKDPSLLKYLEAFMNKNKGKLRDFNEEW
ncbi:RAMP superfamily CRISPR-associated protein [Sulfurisphaera javensis]|uniref:RAMP superfamily CRISPR-associated protein n=1 Tax=Sulfurisphaera javensis TaxID=2049879 RepID=A0AAT9GV90_9CREN